MGNINENPRNTAFEIDSMFYDRWSPRSFKNDPLTIIQINSLFEAARWAPSCFNEQPWLFIYATKNEDRELFLTALSENNQIWVKNSPLIIFVCVKKIFEHNNKPNRWANFDCGAAWMSLALQARKLGLYAHAMAGFNKDKALDITKADKDKYDIIAAIAVGYRDDASKLINKDQQEMENPNERNPLENMIKEKHI